MDKNHPLVLVILDGWGLNDQIEGNAIAQAKKPGMERILARCPHTYVRTSGEDVGLPEGQMGNSEVGHLNIGAGRVVYQDFSRISLAIEDGSFFANSVLQRAVAHTKSYNSSLHLMGLLSDGGVHSHIDHLFALLEMAYRENIKKVYLHAFLDGRDVPPTNAVEYIKTTEQRMKDLKTGTISTISGRYYAMDRDMRWDRVEKAYRALVFGEGFTAESAEEAVLNSYKRSDTDEFVKPTVIMGDSGDGAKIQDGDAVIFFNFRPDRARELTRAFVDEEFRAFKRAHKPDVFFVCMTEYDKTIDAPVAFKPLLLKNTLGEVLSKNGLTQLRLAETEKYAHVTFFFNGGVEEPFPGEDRVLIPSPKVATYDLQPEMSACEITDTFSLELMKNKYQVIIMNYANADMVGHTGDLKAAVKAIEVVDDCLGRLVEKVVSRGGTVLITADHGNAEKMVDECGSCHTAHTINPCPFILCSNKIDVELRPGRLEDIAPTILHLLGLPKPPEMTGKSLISKIRGGK